MKKAISAQKKSSTSKTVVPKYPRVFNTLQQWASSRPQILAYTAPSGPSSRTLYHSGQDQRRARTGTLSG